MKLPPKPRLPSQRETLQNKIIGATIGIGLTAFLIFILAVTPY